MIYPVILRTIQRGEYDPEAILETLDGLFAAGRITTEQYEELTGMVVEGEQLEEERPAVEESGE